MSILSRLKKEKIGWIVHPLLRVLFGRVNIINTVMRINAIRARNGIVTNPNQLI
jgi:nitrogen fixation protein FixH